MKLSARSRYAARILLELARNTNETPLSAASLSQYTGVSAQFVEQILKPLKQAGITTSVRGAAGGHKLARPMDSISLGDIVRLMEGGVQVGVCCGEKGNNCPRQQVCQVRRTWDTVSRGLEKELNTISLSHLLVNDGPCMGGLKRTSDKRNNSALRMFESSEEEDADNFSAASNMEKQKHEFERAYL